MIAYRIPIKHNAMTTFFTITFTVPRSKTKIQRVLFPYGILGLHEKNVGRNSVYPYGDNRRYLSGVEPKTANQLSSPGQQRPHY
jgi:hypothetical protein